MTERILERKVYTKLVYKTHSEVDLTDSNAAAEFFEAEKPYGTMLKLMDVGLKIAYKDFLSNEVRSK